MSSINLAINDSRARTLLSRAPESVRVVMRGGMEDATTYGLAKVKSYPPQRVNSNYKRTNTLKRSWSRKIEGDGLIIRGIIGSNGNMAPYNRRVQDRTLQARIHRGRWNTIQDIAEQSAPRVQRFFDDRLRAAGL